MVQRSKLSGFFRKSRSFNVRIAIPALAVGASVEYSQSHPKIKPKLRSYGCFNWFFISNTTAGDAVLKVTLDFNESRSYLTDHIEKVTDLEFLEFGIENVGTDALLVDEAVIHFGYAIGDSRITYLVDKILGGGRNG